jgi:UDP-galactopyranose mutase
VLAERLATRRGASCLVLDRRDRIAANADGRYDAAGLLIHTCGPHHFRTNSEQIVDSAEIVRLRVSRRAWIARPTR